MATPAAAGNRRGGRRLLLLAGAVLAVYFCVLSVRIARQQWRDEARPADAIVVFGAAQYAGRPSPIFKARLDHAWMLYQRQLAQYVIVSGGAGADPQFSEGGVGRDYLARRGIPEDRLIAETQGDNTSHEAERIANIMKTNRMRSCIAVSDPYHIYRIKAAMGRHGVVAYGSPRPEQADAAQRVAYVLREAVSYLLWQLHLT